MIDYQYSYLIGNLILAIFWLFLFLKRKDARKEILTIGTIFGIAAILTSRIYAVDWWRPLTISGNLPALEDFLFGFFIGGISSTIYEYFSNKKIRIKKSKKRIIERRNLRFYILGIILATVFFASFFILKFNSFVSTIIAFITPLIIIYKRRPDLIKNSVLSGFLVFLMSIVSYYILNLITPGFFDEFWLFQNIGRIVILGIPLEEHVFYLLMGMCAGPLYEYWQEGKLINIKNKK